MGSRQVTGTTPVVPAGRGATQIRAGLLLLLASAATAGVRHLVAPPLGRVLEHVKHGGSPTDLPLVDLVAAGCAAAVLVCWLWCLVSALTLGASVLRHGQARAATLRRSPAPVRIVVLAALGATAMAPPATAVPVGVDDGAAARPSARAVPGVSGLPLPDRVTTAPASTDSAPPARTVRVRPGDSLWQVAERLLPDGASPAAVDRTWRALAGANASRVGTDPDLIFPGTVLRVPDLGASLGKETS